MHVIILIQIHMRGKNILYEKENKSILRYISNKLFRPTLTTAKKPKQVELSNWEFYLCVNI